MKDLDAAVRAAYPESKREWDRTYPVIYYLWRPLSFPVSAALMRRGVSANQVTAATAVMGLGGLAGLASEDPAARLVGALAFVLYNFFDCVDGDIARAGPPERPPRGKFFDQLVGNTYPLVYLALGLGLRGTPGAWSGLALGAAATASKLLLLHVRDIFWAVLGPTWGSHKERTGFTPHSGRWYYRAYYNLCDFQAHAILLPVLLLLDAAPLFLALSAALAAAELAAFVLLYVRRALSMKGPPA